MNEAGAIYLANRVGQLELDKASLLSDLADERKLRASLEQRVSKLEVNDGNAVPEGPVEATK